MARLSLIYPTKNVVKIVCHLFARVEGGGGQDFLHLFVSNVTILEIAYRKGTNITL